MTVRVRTGFSWLWPRGWIQQYQLFEVSPCVSYIQTVHIYFYIHTYHRHVEKQKNKTSYQTVKLSSDGMLNASTDSVHEHTPHTHVHDTRAYKQRHTHFVFFPLSLHAITHFETNTHTLSFFLYSFLGTHALTHTHTRTQIRATCGRRLTLQDWVSDSLYRLSTENKTLLFLFHFFFSLSAIYLQQHHDKCVSKVERVCLSNRKRKEKKKNRLSSSFMRSFSTTLLLCTKKKSWFDGMM